MLAVKVTLMEEDQEISGSSIIFGGKGVAGYDLQCTGVPIGGSSTVLQAKLQVGKSQDLAIISHFTDLTPALEQGRMETAALFYAFHFVGYDDITLNCTVFACRNEDATCQIPVHAVHKRAVNQGSSPRTEYAEAQIRFVDELLPHIIGTLFKKEYTRMSKGMGWGEGVDLYDTNLTLKKQFKKTINAKNPYDIVTSLTRQKGGMIVHVG
ncbi:hypothetical protein CHS0354_020024 [Potamilus streckersoni]|uniref:Uncharacterized protein n=1 Tax=Potamilus streckersoni TaxID=2493646 RepID=A0AAE0VQG4_9BIVA|nr:hypothetical protein CHS0354_020024 [Potamilus streckersoni]